MTTKRRAIGGLIVVVLAGAGVAAYFAVVPDKLVGDYRERALREHDRLDQAMERVFDSFFPTVTSPGAASGIFGARSARGYDRAARRYAAVTKRRARIARRLIERARRRLQTAEPALTDVPSAPFIGVGGPLAVAERVAKLERRFVAGFRVYLRRYEALLVYLGREAAFVRVVGRRQGSAKSLERLAEDLEPILLHFGRVRPPADMRRRHRETLAHFRDLAVTLRRLVAAVRARDVARVEELERSFNARTRPRLTGPSLVRDSSYVRMEARLDELDGRISGELDDL